MEENGEHLKCRSSHDNEEQEPSRQTIHSAGKQEQSRRAIFSAGQRPSSSEYVCTKTIFLKITVFIYFDYFHFYIFHFDIYSHSDSLLKSEQNEKIMKINRINVHVLKYCSF